MKNTTRSGVFAIFTTMAFAFLPAATQAADFTFDVPVEIDAEGFAEGQVVCFVYANADRTGTPLAITNYARVPLANGQYNGTVRVQADATRDSLGRSRAAEGEAYMCRIHAIAVRSGSGPFFGPATQPDFEQRVGREVIRNISRTQATLP